MANSVIDTLTKHVTIRNFLPDAISDELLMSILNAARRSPTSSNMQTYSMVVVKNPEVKKQLAVLAGNQKHIEVCPVFVAFCADLHKLSEACDLHGVTLAKGLESTLVSTVDASLVGMSVQTAAEASGLGAVMIGAMRNHPKEVAELLGLPNGVYVVYGMCLGYPDESKRSPQKPRLQEELMIHFETYKTEGTKEKLAVHNQDLAAHYNALGTNQDEQAWTGPIAKRLDKQSRPELRKTLESLGFSFD